MSKETRADIASLIAINLGMFLVAFLFTGPLIGDHRALAVGAVILTFSIAATAIAFFYGRGTAAEHPAPKPPQPPTASEIARAVVETLERMERAYDPEAVGVRLTTVQAELARLSEILITTNAKFERWIAR